ncbi:MAG: hypothetical protein ACREUQ_09730, partial [Burkholderiales bacterium]
MISAQIRIRSESLVRYSPELHLHPFLLVPGEFLLPLSFLGNQLLIHVWRRRRGTARRDCPASNQGNGGKSVRYEQAEPPRSSNRVAAWKRWARSLRMESRPWPLAAVEMLFVCKQTVNLYISQLSIVKAGVAWRPVYD